MKLIRVAIEQPETIGRYRSSLDKIGFDAVAMFIGYDTKTFKSIGNIYLIPTSKWHQIAIELDTENIDFQVLSNHKITLK